MKRKIKTYTISAVAELYDIHPQTLRLYEREGLLKPSRSVGNTRLYEDSDLERLEVILSLTRDLGVNLAGVEGVVAIDILEEEGGVVAVRLLGGPHHEATGVETGGGAAVATQGAEDEPRIVWRGGAGNRCRKTEREKRESKG